MSPPSAAPRPHSLSVFSSVTNTLLIVPGTQKSPELTAAQLDHRSLTHVEPYTGAAVVFPATRLSRVLV